jgi:hypothetical protein
MVFHARMSFLLHPLLLSFKLTKNVTICYPKLSYVASKEELFTFLLTKVYKRQKCIFKKIILNKFALRYGCEGKQSIGGVFLPAPHSCEHIHSQVKLITLRGVAQLWVRAPTTAPKYLKTFL